MIFSYPCYRIMFAPPVLILRKLDRRALSSVHFSDARAVMTTKQVSYYFLYLLPSLETWGSFLEGFEKFSHPESRSKISDLMITELLYSHILDMNSGSLQRSLRRIQLSVFEYRLTKNGFAGPNIEKFPGLLRNELQVSYYFPYLFLSLETGVEEVNCMNEAYLHHIPG